MNLQTNVGVKEGKRTIAAGLNKIEDAYAGWRAMVAKYQEPDIKTSVWQIINSFGGLFLCGVVMYYSLSISHWLTLLLAFPTAGFLVRIFIIQHDCGHASFFKSRAANDWVGVACSIVTMIPYRYWRKSHAIHHATHAELEERGTGDIWTMTIDEYIQASWFKRMAYRVFRNPVFLFGFAGLFNFLVLGRFQMCSDADWKASDKASVWWTNLALAGVITALSLTIGFVNFLWLWLPMMTIASSVGTFLFYVQHQFEDTYWEHTPEWDYTLAALHGSSYCKLPKVLQWFTGNIGFHHIHHLSPRIPNYKLEECHSENPQLQRVVQLTLWDSLKTVRLALWDEERRRLVSFRDGLRSREVATT